MTTTLPGAISADAHRRALDACVAALGPEAVITDPRDLREYRDPYAYRGSDEGDASAAVLPVTVEQVQAVVRIANEHKVPLWTFGQGHNVTYGGPAPRVRGSILVSLRRMNRVLEVNSELAYVVVEPGVRWFDLHEALAADGSGLWTSLSDLGYGSVVGNVLEYGVGYTPYGDHATVACGLEIVLPDGSLLRTGMGAQPGNPAWHAYPHSYGPSFAGLFQQSNLGIITRMGFWVMRHPQAYSAYLVAFDGPGTLAPVVDALRELMLDRTIENYPILMRGFDVDDSGTSRPNPAGGGGWAGRFALYGRPSVVDAQYGAVQDLLTRIPGVRLFRRAFSGDDVSGLANHYERAQRGIPDMDMLNPAILPYGEFTGHLDFSPVVPATGRDVARTEELVRSIYDRHGHRSRAAIYLRPRSALQISSTFFDTRDERQTTSVYDGYAELVTEVARQGYGAPYRTNLRYMDLVAGQFSFGDHAQLRLAQTIKDALDPHGILSPGKSGIWPSQYRGARPGR